MDLHVQLGCVSLLEAEIDKHRPQFLLDLAQWLMRDGKAQSYLSSYKLASKCSEKRQKEKGNSDASKTKNTSDGDSQASD